MQQPRDAGRHSYTSKGSSGKKQPSCTCIYLCTYYVQSRRLARANASSHTGEIFPFSIYFLNNYPPPSSWKVLSSTLNKSKFLLFFCQILSIFKFTLSLLSFFPIYKFTLLNHPVTFFIKMLETFLWNRYFMPNLAITN